MALVRKIPIAIFNSDEPPTRAEDFRIWPTVCFSALATGAARGKDSSDGGWSWLLHGIDDMWLQARALSGESHAFGTAGWFRKLIRIAIRSSSTAAVN